PQSLTGKTFGTAFAPGTQSIDQFIASKLGSATKLPSLNLGVLSKNESHFFNNGSRLTNIDSPSDAFQTAFGSVSAAPMLTGAGGSATAMPRTSILDLVSGQIAKLRANVGSEAKKRLDAHLASIAQLEKSLSPSSAGGASSVSCATPTAPSFAGNAEDGASSAAVAAAHANLITQAFACDVTRVAGMQFGISNNQFLQYTPSAGNEEHSMVHSPGSGDAAVLASEKFLCDWFVNLVTTLKNTTDPLNPGSTMLDNTLIVWVRDIGDGPAHVNYSLPFVLAGGQGYLKKAPGGTYVDFGGDNATGTVGTSHQRLLLNLAEFMGITDYTGFGDFSK
ncbi:MAG: DUF1552 domain-containing protein, partial [Deltaproteobacteria bacterium]